MSSADMRRTGLRFVPALIWKVLLPLASVIAAFAAGPAGAQDGVAAFFKDKQIRLVIGGGAGSGFDINGRVLARHWPNHIPGKPSMLVQNQPGGGSVTAANSLYASGPRDGTAIGGGINGLPTATLFQPETAKFDPDRIIWVGSTNRDNIIAFAWHTAPVQSITDLKAREFVVGASSVGTSQYDFPVVARAILGLKFKVVAGYKGTAEILVAMERDEVQGLGALAYQSLRALNPAWIAERKVNIFLQYGLVRHPTLPDVPTLLSLASSPADIQALRLLVARVEYGRPFFLPPDVPAVRVEALRRAFDATMRDPAYLADAARTGLDVSPMTGEEMTKLIASLLATPPAIVNRVRDALVEGAKPRN